MLFDPVTTTEIQAAQLLTGATMAAFVAASFVRGRARMIRTVVLAVYLTGILGFVVYSMSRAKTLDTSAAANGLSRP
jgi:VIT1/CCC1 family predicted Fe2+/Mn2+ transporter